jgi:tetratricopeptide (TPR) repeat protein
MPDFAYIERFFKGELNAEELKEFEHKIKNDPVFAEEVAFYSSVMHLYKKQLAEERKERFRKLYEERKAQRKQERPALVRRLWPYAAAAVMAGLIFGVYMYLRPPSLQNQANQFIKKNFEIQMGVQMTGKEDSLDAAIQSYNEGKLPKALQQFEKLIQSDSTASSPKRMAGIVSLRLGNYDKAIEYFTQLENLQRSSNPGKLYHALALIKRGRTGDKETVRQLLKQVMDNNLDGKETAQKWMESL